MSALTPLETLCETKRGKALRLPPTLARLYGTLRMPLPHGRPHIISNFVTTLDGVVSLNVKGHASGRDVSGFSQTDRMVMGLLRAIADVVIVGAGTLRVGPDHVWTAEYIFPDLADDYRRLRASVGKREPPLNVVVSASGELDLGWRVFASGEAPTLIVTTSAGAKRLRKQTAPDSVTIRAVRSAGAIRARTIINQVGKVRASTLILVEGGPQLLADFYAQHLLDEQFLTLAPQLAGRDDSSERPGIVMGRTFAPRNPLWGTLVDARSGSSHLFLRYAFAGDG
ncbi:MAG: dihydrofolate reductase family protein [Chloroflexota bacterium]